MTNSTNSTTPCVPVELILAQIDDWTLHWSVHLAFYAWYVIVFLIGIGGNSAMIYTIVKRKRVRAVANVFMVSLAISDMLLCLTAIPLAPIIFLSKQWYFGNFCCKMMPYCQALSVIVTHVSLCSIAIDRFRNICQPQKNHWNVMTSRIITLANWLFSAIVNIPYYLSHTVTPLSPDGGDIFLCGVYCGEYLWKSPFYKQMYGTLMLCLTFVAPFLMQCYCCIRILFKVRRDMLVGAEVGPQRLIAIQRKRRVMSTLVTMMVAFAVSWMPLTLVNILRDYHVTLGYLEQQPFFAQLLAHAIAMTSVIWIPILYFWMSKSHRQALRRELLLTLSRARSVPLNSDQRSVLLTHRVAFDSENINRIVFDIASAVSTPLPPRSKKETQKQKPSEQRVSITSSCSAPLLSDRTISSALSDTQSTEVMLSARKISRSVSHRVKIRCDYDAIAERTNSFELTQRISFRPPLADSGDL